MNSQSSTKADGGLGGKFDTNGLHRSLQLCTTIYSNDDEIRLVLGICSSVDGLFVCFLLQFANQTEQVNNNNNNKNYHPMANTNVPR